MVHSSVQSKPSPTHTLTHTLTRRHTAKGFTRWQSSFTVKQIEKLFPFARKKIVQSEGEQQIWLGVHSMWKRVQKNLELNVHFN